MTKKRIFSSVFIVILILLLSGLLTYKLMHKSDKQTKVAKEVDTIKGFNYKLEDRDIKLYKEEFKKLKANLESNDIDYEKYAKSIAKMFIIDLYTIDNKVNKYDIGGLEFVHPDAKENYELNVKDTIYKYVDDNSDKSRTQQLPEVASITVKDFKESKFKIEDKEVDSYDVSLEWKYKEDLKYDDNALISIVKKGKKLYIVEKKELDNQEQK